MKIYNILSIILLELCFVNTIQATTENNIQKEICMKNEESEKNNIGIIDINVLKVLLSSKVDILLLDARTSKWDDGQRISNALSLTSESSSQSIASVIPNKESLIIIYCSHSQCGAGNRLAMKLNELGYFSILKYPGGIDEWTSLGNPVTTKSKGESI